MTDDEFAAFMREVAIAHQIPIHLLLPLHVMAEAAFTLGMFIMWAWVDEATFDGKTFWYSVRLDDSINFVEYKGTVST